METEEDSQACLDLGLLANDIALSNRRELANSFELARYFHALIGNSPQERVIARFLDAEGRSLGEEEICTGCRSRVAMRARHIFARALILDASGFLLVHNHPSGDARPSEQDIASTHYLAQLAAALDLELVDHLIIGNARAYSMRAGGLL